MNYSESKNIIEASRLFQELMDGYLFHTKKMNESAKNCFKYFYTIIKGDYNLNSKVLKYVEAFGYENDLEITYDLDYSFTLASFTMKSLKKEVKKLKRD